jgi:kynureninase
MRTIDYPKDRPGRRHATIAAVSSPLAAADPAPLDPASIAAFYGRFRVSDRVLLTGHSHQAWPDAALDGQERAWLDAAELVDAKWGRAEAQAQRVREGFAELLGDRPAHIALAQNTHELVTRWLSALPLRQRPRLVTTDGEFHSLRRQLDRLAEESMAIDVVAARPVETLAERLCRAVDDTSAAVLVSSVLFETSEIVPGLDLVSRACERTGAALLVDVYHQLNVVPFDVAAAGLESAFITGGGYKYCQLGEGNCFLRLPAGTRLRPVLTGWFAEDAGVEGDTRVEAGAAPSRSRVHYREGAAAFGGATYDPTSHYRAAAVFDFHRARGLVPTRLRTLNQRQTRLLLTAFESLDLDPSVARIEPVPDDRRGGFVAIRTPWAREVVAALRAQDVSVDARGSLIRLGPAPYVTDGQIAAGMALLGESLRARAGR